MVIINILDNAVKFAEAGSPLDIRLFKQNGRAYISIIDRGETIPEDELSSIFQRFHKSDRSRSLDRSVRGSLLGLLTLTIIVFCATAMTDVAANMAQIILRFMGLDCLVVCKSSIFQRLFYLF